MFNSDTEMSETSDYEIEFDHDDSDIGDTHTAAHNVVAYHIVKNYRL